MARPVPKGRIKKACARLTAEANREDLLDKVVEEAVARFTKDMAQKGDGVELNVWFSACNAFRHVMRHEGSEFVVPGRIGDRNVPDDGWLERNVAHSARAKAAMDLKLKESGICRDRIYEIVRQAGLSDLQRVAVAVKVYEDGVEFETVPDAARAFNVSTKDLIPAIILQRHADPAFRAVVHRMRTALSPYFAPALAALSIVLVMVALFVALGGPRTTAPTSTLAVKGSGLSPVLVSNDTILAVKGSLARQHPSDDVKGSIRSEIALDDAVIA